jgi:hypothetical protein
MKRIHFATSAWFKSQSHPVYILLRDNPPEGWEFGAATPEVADLVVVPTCPTYSGPKPWLVFIEDWVTLYNDHFINGSTAGKDVLAHPKTAALRRQFAAPNCAGIVCHHRGTFADLVHLGLTPKLHYVPVGLPPRDQLAIGTRPELHLTFTNSWMAGDTNFRNRGGEIVIRAFRELYQAGNTHLRLTLQCPVPGNVAPVEWDFLQSCPAIQVIWKDIEEAALHALIQTSDCILLPSHRVHVHSILLPFSFGIPVLSSDGWGNEEYVIDGSNGFRVRGVWGKTSWRDDLMREDYARWPETLSAVAELKARIMAFSDSRSHLQRCGDEAHDYVNDVHPIHRQRALLKRIFEGSL